MEPGMIALIERIANSLGNIARDLSSLRQELKDIKEFMKEEKDNKEILGHLKNQLNNALEALKEK